jgi:hypothetical protein
MGIHLALVSLSARADAKPVPLTASPTSEGAGVFSPNGRWIAYVADQSGVNEVYLREFDPSDPVRSRSAIPVSIDGGTAPRWRADGKELFYQAGQRIVSVAVGLDATPTLGKPQTLFSLPVNSFGWVPVCSGAVRSRLFATLPTVSRIIINKITLSVVLRRAETLKQVSQRMDEYHHP